MAGYKSLLLVLFVATFAVAISPKYIKYISFSQINESFRKGRETSITRQDVYDTIWNYVTNLDRLKDVYEIGRDAYAAVEEEAKKREEKERSEKLDKLLNDFNKTLSEIKTSLKQIEIDLNSTKETILYYHGAKNENVTLNNSTTISNMSGVSVFIKCKNICENPTMEVNGTFTTDDVIDCCQQYYHTSSGYCLNNSLKCTRMKQNATWRSTPECSEHCRESGPTQMSQIKLCCSQHGFKAGRCDVWKRVNCY